MLLPRNILIFHLGALGDFIITWPLALMLARLHPQSRVFYVTQAEKGALAAKVLKLESLDVEAGWHGLYSDTPSLPESLMKRLAASHTIVHFGAAPEERWAASVRAMVPQADVITLSSKPPAEYAGHVSEFILEQLASRPAPHTAAQQILKSVASRGVTTLPAPEPTIVVHPGAGSPTKCWPARCFVELIVQLRDAGRPVRILLGEVERERWAKSEIDQLTAIAEVIHPGSLLDLLEQIRSASCFIGNDSGPGHLSGILGVPTVAIFGDKDPTRWRPLGPKVRVVQGTSLESVSVKSVLDAVNQSLDNRQG